MASNYRVVHALGAGLLAGLFAACSHSQPKAAASWNPSAAATYLDQREAWWMGWKVAARDHETFCVSCHTVLPYALSRASLRPGSADQVPTVNEQRLLDNVRKRVRLWKEVSPYYGDQDYGANKAAESRGTEAVLNALILAVNDARRGQLSDDTRAAFDNMWALQQTTGEKKGAWRWLDFGLRPWEAKDSQYFGAALAALAVGTAPQNYRSTPNIQNNLQLLRAYLDSEYSTQSSFDRMVLLYASTKLPNLLIEPERRESIIREVLSKQLEDGGWSLSSLKRTWRGSTVRAYVRSWIRQDGTPVESKSDGYATGLAVFVLEQEGTARENAQVAQGLNWLVRNQNKTDGSWPGYSLNKSRNPASNVGHFMSDAATAYAALALTEAIGN